MHPDADREQLEKRKADLIAKYLELQELVDETNGKIYELTVEIAAINARIEGARQPEPHASR